MTYLFNMTPIFLATVEKDKLVLDSPENFSLWLGQFVGKRVEVIVRKKRKPRTTGKSDELGNQNGYYWAVVLPICSKEFGYTIDEMHEVFIELYAPYKIKEFKGNQIKLRVRTSEMDTVQFATYTDTIRQAMAEMNIIIPDPDKMYYKYD